MAMLQPSKRVSSKVQLVLQNGLSVPLWRDRGIDPAINKCIDYVQQLHKCDQKCSYRGKK